MKPRNGRRQMKSAWPTQCHGIMSRCFAEKKRSQWMLVYHDESIVAEFDICKNQNCIDIDDYISLLLESFLQASNKLLLKDALNKLSFLCEPLSHMTQCNALFSLPEKTLSFIRLSSVIDLKWIDWWCSPSLSICWRRCRCLGFG